MILNRAMQAELANIDQLPLNLPSKLASIGTGGFIFVNGCYILRSRSSLKTNASLDDFPDLTGYELFINSIHIDDYVADQWTGYACKLVETIFSDWNKAKELETLRAIIATEEKRAVVKIHLVRAGEFWFPPRDIENFLDPIMVVESNVEFDPLRLFRH